MAGRGKFKECLAKESLHGINPPGQDALHLPWRKVNYGNLPRYMPITSRVNGGFLRIKNRRPDRAGGQVGSVEHAAEESDRAVQPRLFRSSAPCHEVNYGNVLRLPCVTGRRGMYRRAANAVKVEGSPQISYIRQVSGRQHPFLIFRLMAALLVCIIGLHAANPAGAVERSHGSAFDSATYEVAVAQTAVAPVALAVPLPAPPPVRHLFKPVEIAVALPPVRRASTGPPLRDVLRLRPAPRAPPAFPN